MGNVHILWTALAIGLATLLMATLGVMPGRVLGTIVGKRTEIAGESFLSVSARRSSPSIWAYSPELEALRPLRTPSHCLGLTYEQDESASFKRSAVAPARPGRA
ncbi:manganese efflux pump MntP family protein [Halomonas sp. McH1-25]|uniref:manganese efflux pump n=1 Tax=unclassified Halomonas TaxID=2609666 RepID=UPI001EF634BE|nr:MULTISPECIES: manganese efflux pump [unclassified Halomonas]MCG7599406.1 manganese efflux pump MntP family protein [Halomonas sp. McH1-25]MCP1344084.1 manganese efflux pump MntP family protein [Halomonas sp. FL8]MCP1362331.1 manganese efflux pump MntP family protein [Halomonas sp. BBD45]MCP1365392.1 manganese efflux pump MntP family protein [Halomonas sp. BBD48]